MLDQLIEKQLAFAAWFFPHEDRPGLLVSNAEDVTYLNQFNHLNGEQGFVFAPYSITEESPVILLKPGKLMEDFSAIESFDIQTVRPFRNNHDQSGDYVYSEKEEYLTTIQDTIDEIKKGDLSKVIISRRIAVDRTNDSVGSVFLELQKQTPNAFTYLVNLPKAGTWVGATPEILLHSNGEKFETVSLAGTQTRKFDSEYSWTTKDIEEQAFVSRYMLDVFYRFNIGKYTTQGPETMESGKVAHLKTLFSFQADRITNCLGDFIADLHPTPAVCGFPKDLASEFIRIKEKYQRKYFKRPPDLIRQGRKRP